MRKQIPLLLRIARRNPAHSGTVNGDPFTIQPVGFFEMEARAAPAS